MRGELVGDLVGDLVELEQLLVRETLDEIGWYVEGDAVLKVRVAEVAHERAILGKVVREVVSESILREYVVLHNGLTCGRKRGLYEIWHGMGLLYGLLGLHEVWHGMGLLQVLLR